MSLQSDLSNDLTEITNIVKSANKRLSASCQAEGDHTSVGRCGEPFSNNFASIEGLNKLDKKILNLSAFSPGTTSSTMAARRILNEINELIRFYAKRSLTEQEIASFDCAFENLLIDVEELELTNVMPSESYYRVYNNELYIEVRSMAALCYQLLQV